MTRPTAFILGSLLLSTYIIKPPPHRLLERSSCMNLRPQKTKNSSFMLDNLQEGRLSRKRKKLKTTFGGLLRKQSIAIGAVCSVAKKETNLSTTWIVNSIFFILNGDGWRSRSFL
uniref:Secreted protein n=1 Tax=Steinernema glaseri TaxID=37863 RepID=A0A1I7ZZZ0_9BILA